MRAGVLGGQSGAWEAGPRSAAELREAATHFERAAALCPAPAMKAMLTGDAECCRNEAQTAVYKGKGKARGKGKGGKRGGKGGD